MKHFNNCVQSGHVCPQGVCVYVSMCLLYSFNTHTQIHSNSHVVIGLWQLVVEYMNLCILKSSQARFRHAKWLQAVSHSVSVGCHMLWSVTWCGEAEGKLFSASGPRNHQPRAGHTPRHKFKRQRWPSPGQQGCPLEGRLWVVFHPCDVNSVDDILLGSKWNSEKNK